VRGLNTQASLRGEECKSQRAEEKDLTQRALRSEHRGHGEEKDNAEAQSTPRLAESD